MGKDAKSPDVEGPTLTWHWQKVKNREYQRQGTCGVSPSKGRSLGGNSGDDFLALEFRLHLVRATSDDLILIGIDDSR